MIRVFCSSMTILFSIVHTCTTSNSVVLANCYPEVTQNIISARRPRVPLGYWKDPNTHRSFLQQLALQLSITQHFAPCILHLSRHHGTQ